MSQPEPVSRRERRALARASARVSTGGRRSWPLSRPLYQGIVAVIAVIAVVVGVAAFNTFSSADQQRIAYDVGRPGPGEPAPDFTLMGVSGEPFRLADQRGRQVLLYFHEGLMCDPCWRQVDDIQTDLEQFRALGIDGFAAISTDPLSAQVARANRTGVALPVLADTSLDVSLLYDALDYGMMGGTLPGHTFILVGQEGDILWRADYGGPPNYTMFVPNTTLLAELEDVLGLDADEDVVTPAASDPVSSESRPQRELS